MCWCSTSQVGCQFRPNFWQFLTHHRHTFGSDQLTMAEAQPEPQNRPEPRGANCQPQFLAAQAAMASGQMTGPLFEVGFSLENYHLQVGHHKSSTGHLAMAFYRVRQSWIWSITGSYIVPPVLFRGGVRTCLSLINFQLLENTEFLHIVLLES